MWAPFPTIEEIILAILMNLSPIIYFVCATVSFTDINNYEKGDKRIMAIIIYNIVYLFFVYSFFEYHFREIVINFPKDIQLFKYFFVLFIAIFVISNEYAYRSLKRKKKEDKLHLSNIIYVSAICLTLLLAMLVYDVIKVSNEDNIYRDDKMVEQYLESKYGKAKSLFKANYKGISIGNKSRFEIIKKFPLVYKKDYVIKYSIECNFLEKPFDILLDKETKEVRRDYFSTALLNDKNYLNAYINYVTKKSGIEDNNVKLIIKNISGIDFSKISSIDDMPYVLYENTLSNIDGLYIEEAFDEVDDNNTYDYMYNKMIKYQKEYFEKVNTLSSVFNINIKNTANNQIYNFMVYNDNIENYVLQIYDYVVYKDDQRIDEIERIRNNDDNSYKNIIEIDKSGNKKYFEYKGKIPFNQDTLLFYLYYIFDKNNKKQEFLNIASDVDIDNIIEFNSSMKISFEVDESNIVKVYEEKKLPIKITKNDKEYDFVLTFEQNEFYELSSIGIENIISENRNVIKINSSKDLSNIIIGSHVYMGRYYQSSINEKEDIEWIVINKNLDDKTVTLMSHRILDVCQYRSKVGKDIINTSLYEDSDVREYINNYFYNEAFNQYEKKLLLKTRLTESVEGKNLNKQEYMSDNMNDYVFLPTQSEVRKYLAKKSNMKAYGTKYAISKNLKVSTKVESFHYASYWTRTINEFRAQYYWDNEIFYVDENGDYNKTKDESMIGFGIRPCVRLKYE